MPQAGGVLMHFSTLQRPWYHGVLTYDWGTSNTLVGITVAAVQHTSRRVSAMSGMTVAGGCSGMTTGIMRVSRPNDRHAGTVSLQTFDLLGNEDRCTRHTASETRVGCWPIIPTGEANGGEVDELNKLDELHGDRGCH